MKSMQGRYGNQGWPWASCWIEEKSGELLYEGGYRTFPAAIARYSKTPGEVYGRGRGDIAFPDASTLNSAKRMGLEDFALKIRPPVLHSMNSVFGTLRLTPGAPTSINTHGKSIRDVIAPFETGSRPEISNIKEEELRRSIREIFFVEVILQLLEMHKSEQTAFEYGRRLELLFRLIGPVYGRLEWEWLHRIVETGFDIMMQAGAFAPPPPEFYNTNGQYRVVFENPIARAQKSGDSEAFLMALNDAAPLGNLKPHMLDWISEDLAMQGILATRGVPAKWVNSDKQVAAIRQARQQEEQRDAQLAEMERMAKAAGDAAPVMKALNDRTGQVAK
jgi:hypothetical protein